MSLTIRDFLLAKFAEDEDVARRAGGVRWVDMGGSVEVNEDDLPEGSTDWTVAYNEGRPSSAQSAHIARHDPARVLAECKAKRQIVELHRLGGVSNDECMGCGDFGVAWPCDMLRTLAAVYADHPEYDPDWRITDGLQLLS